MNQQTLHLLYQQTGRRQRVFWLLVTAIALLGTVSTTAQAATACWPATRLPAVSLPPTTIPGVTIPASTIPPSCFAGTCYPGHHYAAVTYPATTIPGAYIAATTIPGGCYTVAAVFSIRNTTIRSSGYRGLDAVFSARLTNRYWGRTGSASAVPDPSAPGYGSYNAAGFPRNEFVKTYFRSDGTMVSGYWRNSSSDGLPTCLTIDC